MKIPVLSARQGKDAIYSIQIMVIKRMGMVHPAIAAEGMADFSGWEYADGTVGLTFWRVSAGIMDHAVFATFYESDQIIKGNFTDEGRIDRSEGDTSGKEKAGGHLPVGDQGDTKDAKGQGGFFVM